MLACANIMDAMVLLFARLRFFENAMPTEENRRSTEAEVAAHAARGPLPPTLLLFSDLNVNLLLLKSLMF